MGYCVHDVVATHRVFENIWPKFQNRSSFAYFPLIRIVALPHSCEFLNSCPLAPADSTRRFAHPVTLAGMLEMSVPYLPVSGNWRAFLQSTDRTYREMREQVNAALRRVADASLSLLPHERSAKPLVYLLSRTFRTTSTVLLIVE